MKEKIRNFFNFRERNTKFKYEIIGGVVSFFAVSYILAVNPAILSSSGNMPASGVFIATALAAGIMTILIGFFANQPIILASGMGLNTFFTYTMSLGMGYSWQEGLAITLMAGVIYFVFSITPLRKFLLKAFPSSLKRAISIGIGFFIAFVGLKNAGIIAFNEGTFVALGNLLNSSVLLGLGGIVLAIILYSVGGKIRRFTFIIAILGTAIIGIILELTFVNGILGISGKEGFAIFNGVSMSNAFGEFREVVFGFTNGFSTVFSKPGGTTFFLVFAILCITLFSATGGIVATTEAVGIKDQKEEIPNIKKLYIVESLGTIVAPILGTSTLVPLIESTSGVKAGAKSGFASVVSGILFLLAIVLYPIFSVFINSFAITSMALVLIGIIMASELMNVDFQDVPVTIATFMTIMMMVLTYSIDIGMSFGVIIYVISMLAAQRYKEINIPTYVLAVIFAIYLIVRVTVLK